jgi:hypothetical protein
MPLVVLIWLPPILNNGPKGQCGMMVKFRGVWIKPELSKSDP